LHAFWLGNVHTRCIDVFTMSKKLQMFCKSLFFVCNRTKLQKHLGAILLDGIEHSTAVFSRRKQ
jgi:hypothetical protein